MVTIFLHVGHGKTGSSFIQSALALSSETLARHGIAYPDLTDSFLRARNGDITAGNIHTSKTPLHEAVEGMLATTPADGKILFSHEELFAYLKSPNSDPFWEMVRTGRVGVELLCFIRDPIGHAVSLYQQTVKRSGNTAPFSRFLENYKVPVEVDRFLDLVEREGVTCRIANYSRNRDVVGQVESWLGLAPDTLERPEKLVVNRSMSNAELALQRQFNHHFGRRSASLISDPLCNRLPHVKSEYPAVQPDELEPFLQRMAKIAGRVNPRLPEGQGYEVPPLDEALKLFRDPDDPLLYAFTEEQLEVIAKRISNLLKKLDW